MLSPEAFFLQSSAPMIAVPQRNIVITEKSLLYFWTSIHTKSIIFAGGCIRWCQSFNEKNFLLGNMEETLKSLGLLHLKLIEIWPLTSVGTELGPKTTTTRSLRGWFAQTLLTKRNNKFPKALGRRPYECLNAFPCATCTFMLCCLHSVLFMVSWAKDRLPAWTGHRGVQFILRSFYGKIRRAPSLNSSSNFQAITTFMLLVFSLTSPVWCPLPLWMEMWLGSMNANPMGLTTMTEKSRNSSVISHRLWKPN